MILFLFLWRIETRTVYVSSLEWLNTELGFTFQVVTSIFCMQLEPAFQTKMSFRPYR